MKNLLTSLVAAALSTGCLGALAQPAPERHVYAFTLERPSGASPTDVALPCVLDVRAFGISPSAAGGSFVYRVDEARFETDYYASFLAGPEALITERVRAWLAAGATLESVLPSGSRQLPTHVLEGNVAELYGDFRGAEAAAVVGLELFLLDASASGGVRWQQRFARRMPLAKRTPDALVAGWERGLAEILGELESALQQALHASR